MHMLFSLRSRMHASVQTQFNFLTEYIQEIMTNDEDICFTIQQYATVYSMHRPYRIGAYGIRNIFNRHMVYGHTVYALG